MKTKKSKSKENIMNKKIKQKIAEEQYKFEKHIFDKTVWFVISFAVASINSTSIFMLPLMAVISAIWFVMYYSMNREHNKWMESIGGKNWREEYNS